MSAASALQPATVVTRASDQLSGEIDGKVVLLSIDNGEYYNMNEVASRIWQLLEKPMAISAIVAQLLLEFEVERPACEEQVMTYLGRLQTNKLLQVVG